MGLFDSYYPSYELYYITNLYIILFKNNIKISLSLKFHSLNKMINI